MEFTIALYGSFEDSNGYTWKLPNNIDPEQLQKIKNKFLKTYEDGRSLHPNEVYGGYFIDADHQVFYAFRFISGKQDSRGREGVIVTNWAVADWFEVKGKSVRSLFDKLSFDTPPDSYEIHVTDDAPETEPIKFPDAAEKSLSGDDVDSVFNLPNCLNTNMLVQFELKNNEKKADIKNYSPPPPKPTRRKEHLSFRRNRSHSKYNNVNGKKDRWGTSPYSKHSRKVFFVVSIVAFLFILIALCPRLFQTWNRTAYGIKDKQKPSAGMGNKQTGRLIPDNKSSKSSNSQNDARLPVLEKGEYHFAIYVLTGQLYSWDKPSEERVMDSLFDKFDISTPRNNLKISPQFSRSISVNFVTSNSFSFMIDGDDSIYQLSLKEDSCVIEKEDDLKDRNNEGHARYSDQENLPMRYSLRKRNEMPREILLVEQNRISLKHSNIPIGYEIMEVNSKTSGYDYPDKIGIVSSPTPIIMFYFWRISNRSERKWGGIDYP